MYEIGQIVYVILSKKNQVYPMQIVETITKRTLKGEEINYILQAGPEKTNRVSLDQVDGEIFETIDKVHKTLLHRATSQITKLIDVASKKSSEWYGSNEIPTQTIDDLPDLITSESQKLTTKEEYQTVSLPDGSMVKIKLPEILKESV